MVAHDDVGMTRIHHRPHDMQRFTNMGPTIDDIADEHRTTLRMLIDTIDATIAEPIQQQAQADGTAMYVADQIDTT
jgi:hypothetical protein